MREPGAKRGGPRRAAAVGGDPAASDRRGGRELQLRRGLPVHFSDAGLRCARPPTGALRRRVHACRGARAEEPDILAGGRVVDSRSPIFFRYGSSPITRGPIGGALAKRQVASQRQSRS